MSERCVSEVSAKIALYEYSSFPFLLLESIVITGCSLFPVWHHVLWCCFPTKTCHSLTTTVHLKGFWDVFDFCVNSRQFSPVDIAVVPFETQAFGSEPIPVSWQSARIWLSHKPDSKLPLLSAPGTRACHSNKGTQARSAHALGKTVCYSEVKVQYRIIVNNCLYYYYETKVKFVKRLDVICCKLHHISVILMILLQCAVCI